MIESWTEVPGLTRSGVSAVSPSKPARSAISNDARPPDS